MNAKVLLRQLNVNNFYMNRFINTFLVHVTLSDNIWKST